MLILWIIHYDFTQHTTWYFHLDSLQHLCLYLYLENIADATNLHINESQKELWKVIVIECVKFVYNIHDQTNYNFLFAFFEVHCTMKIEVKHM